MRPAIRVENLSKCYRIGGPKRKGRNLSEVLSDGVNSVWSKVRRLADSNVAEAGTQEFWALKDVSFEVPEGEVVGIIGRNGAGKSTLLKILSRIVEPTSGSAEIHGRLGSLLEVGTGFNPELTGRENIYLNGSILGMKKREIDAKFDEIVAFSEVEQFLDTPVKRYSSGMYVRLAFAVAAHLEPDVLIIDEVLAVGDAAFQKKCLELMNSSAKAGRTILFVSHNMATMRNLCTLGCVFNAGSIVCRGKIDDCINHYMGGDEKLIQHRTTYKRPANLRKYDHWVEEAEVLTCANDCLLVGDRLSLRVDVRFKQATLTPRIGVVVNSIDGEHIFNANNSYQKFEYSGQSTKQGRFVCDFGKVPLMSGVYSVSIWLGDQNGDSDVLQDCLYFEVVEKDIWGTGICPPRNAGAMWWPTAFSFASMETEGQRGT